MSINQDWALSLLQNNRRPQNTHQNDGDVVEQNATEAELRAEATEFLETVSRALPFRRAGAHADPASSTQVVQVSRPRYSDWGWRWCVIRLDALTLDWSLTWYVSPTNSDLVYRDGVGLDGHMVPVENTHDRLNLRPDSDRDVAMNQVLNLALS